jgi:amidohydrolase
MTDSLGSLAGGFLARAEALSSYTQELRRDLHMHPEPAFEEVRTAGIVAKELRDLGLEIKTGVGGTGVMATLRGRQPGPLVLLRADMDALPITEETGASYASQNPGFMHACGHDGHTAIMLTVARMLHAVRSELGGSIRFVFQPAEERAHGAMAMIEQGVMDDPEVDAVLCLHLWNEKPVGWLGIAPGPIMAASDEFTIRLTGPGGHGAMPDGCADPVLAGAQIVTALQSIVARDVSPLRSAVVSVTTVHGGETFNVIPSQVELSGTIRAFEPEVRDTVMRRFREIVEGVGAAMGVAVEIEFGAGTPAVINDAGVTAVIQDAARRILPDHQVDAGAPFTLGSEDFSFFLERAPGCFFFVGSANAKKGLDAHHHHRQFDFDEVVLPRAAALMAEGAVEVLSRMAAVG